MLTTHHCLAAGTSSFMNSHHVGVTILDVLRNHITAEGYEAIFQN